MADYETYQFGAVVTLSHNEIGYSDEDMASFDEDELQTVREELEEACIEWLEQQVIDDIRDAADLTQNKKSYILAFLGVQQAPKRRTVRRKRAR